MLQMLNAYSRAFGTAKERAALQDLIAVLGQMVTNRDRAAGLGDKTAATDNKVPSGGGEVQKEMRDRRVPHISPLRYGVYASDCDYTL